MENSSSYISNSGRTLDNSQMNSNLIYRNIKKSLYNFSKKDININLNKNNSSLNIFVDKTPFTSLAKNQIKIKNIFNRFTPSCFRKNNKFGNFCIFGKRELAFQKNMEEGRRVFKYQQSIGLEKKNQTIIANKNFINNSLYLTESMVKSTKNKTALPLIDKDKSINDEDMSSIFYKNISFSKNSYINQLNMGSLFINKDNDTNKTNKANTTKNQSQKGIIYLKKLNINKTDEDENKKNRIIKKIDFLEKKALGNKSIKKYIQDFRKIILSKYNFDIKQEKVKVINESLKSQKGKVDYKLEDLNKNQEFFIKEFYPKLNEYVKHLGKLLEKERHKNLLYVNKIYVLDKDISEKKNKIIKLKTEKDILIKEMLSQIVIQEKRINLPEYYKDILINQFSFKQIQKKYGTKIDNNEFNRVLKYKNSLEPIGIDDISEKINVLTNENIKLLNQYNKLCENNLIYKKEIEKTEKELNLEADEETDYLIIQKEKKLNIIKNKCKNTQIILNTLLKLKGYKKNEKNEKNKMKHSELYLKIEMIMKNLNENLKYEIDKEDRIKGKITEEKKILENIRKIEVIVSIFLSRYKEEEIKYPEKVKNLKRKLDKEKKFKKTYDQRKKNFLKIESEREKIFRKYNKVLFLPRRKVYFKKPLKKISFVQDLDKLDEKGNKTDEFLYY